MQTFGVARLVSLRRLLVTLVAPALVACGGPPAAGPAPAVPAPIDATSAAATPEPPPTPPPRDADRRLVRALDPNIVAIVHLADAKAHPLAPQVAELDAVKGVIAGTGIDPVEEVDRVFVAAQDLADGRQVAALAEHHADPTKVEAALKKMVADSGEAGAWLEDHPFPAARVEVEGRTSVVMLVLPTLLAVTSEQLAPKLDVLAGTGGLPEPTGEAAVVADVRRPAENLRARGAPAIPPTLSKVHAELTFLDGGDARLDVDAQSTDENQARLDAKRLTDAIDDATSVKVSIIRVRAFDPVRFRSEGDRVVARRRITKAEMTSLLGFAKMLQR